ncbi:UNVERIFIED_CONTAM: hypothetical protein Slati_2883700 [Sesamum latifolium]|uniref:Reverse transcriptase domain-containing protein n=1 Tax=Sesamum latifolium TaxID=2727402 RepID=A0AAW2VBI0_9LAMI
MVAQLWPISLCNVIVKATSKCVANRLKPMLDSIISQSQSAFIHGRLITDNVLLAFELNHYIHSSQRSKGGCVALKLDMSKAYDRVEWAFFHGTSLRFGFNHRFVELIMLLVTTVSYSLTLNVNHFGYFVRSVASDRVTRYLHICSSSMQRLFLFALGRQTTGPTYRDSRGTSGTKGIPLALC